MQVKCDLLKADDLGRMYLSAGPQAVEDIHAHNLSFWTTRNRAEFSDEEKREIIAGQKADTTPYNRGATLKLQDIYAEARKRGPFSMLEIGAANGNVMERLKARDPNPTLTYVGFECLPLLVEDFRGRFPDQTMHVGAVEDFIAKDRAFFQEAPFTLFYACTVFDMIKPDLVLDALRKAARLAEQFLIWDYIEDPGVTPVPGEALVIHMQSRPVFWFAHRWDDYLAEVGFKVVDKEVAQATDAEAVSPSFDHQLKGFGFIHATRR